MFVWKSVSKMAWDCILRLFSVKENLSSRLQTSQIQNQLEIFKQCNREFHTWASLFASRIMALFSKDLA